MDKGFRGGKDMVNGLPVDDEIERINNFFNNLQIEEFEEMCNNAGMNMPKENDIVQELVNLGVAKVVDGLTTSRKNIIELVNKDTLTEEEME